MTTKKDDYYFPHDMGARNDPKIMAIRMKHGALGYGIYFMLIEMLRAQKDHCILIEDVPQVLFDIRCTQEQLNSVLNDFGLFIIDENKFYSPRLCDSMEVYKLLREKRIEAGRKGGLSTAKARIEQSSSNATTTERQGSSIKVKESKVKESKRKEIKYVSDSNEFRLASLLYSLMKTNNEKTKEPNMQQWCKDIDQAHRIDGHDFEDIEKVIRWTQQDSFEQKNVLSPGKLRKRFAGLWMNAKDSNGRNPTDEEIDKALGVIT